MTAVSFGPGGSASVFVLHEGYVGRDGDDERVAGTITLILDGDAVIAVNPGMVASRPDQDTPRWPAVPLRRATPRGS